MSSISGSGKILKSRNRELFVVAKKNGDSSITYLNKNSAFVDDISSDTWFFDQIPPSVFGQDCIVLKFKLECDPFFFPVSLD